MAFDFDAAVTAPFSMQPGLHRMAGDAKHLSPAGPGSRHQREKLAVLSAFWQQALGVREGFDERPAVRALAGLAAREHPQVFAWDGENARALGVQVCAGRLTRLESGSFGTGDEISRCLLGLPERWRLAGLLALAFEEDFVLVDCRDGSIPWLAVALPSQWAPEEALGRPLATVPALAADEGPPFKDADQIIARVMAGERWERFVWTITGQPRLHAHPARVDPQPWPQSRDPAVIASQAWWRTERQTFLPLPGLRQALCTLRVEVTPLADALREPAKAQRVHDALAAMSPAALRCRGLEEVREPLLRWLATRAGTAGPRDAPAQLTRPV